MTVAHDKRIPGGLRPPGVPPDTAPLLRLGRGHLELSTYARGIHACEKVTRAELLKTCSSVQLVGRIHFAVTDGFAAGLDSRTTPSLHACEKNERA